MLWKKLENKITTISIATLATILTITTATQVLAQTDNSQGGTTNAVKFFSILTKRRN